MAIGGCSGSKSIPSGPNTAYTLPLTRGTVQAAVDLLTTGTDTVPVQCGATVPVDCPSGTPGPTITVALDRVADSIVLIDSSFSSIEYTFSAHLTLTTNQDIPLTLPVVGECGLHVDTSPGASPTVHVSGQAHFTSSVGAGPLDELMVTVGLDGLEAADVSLTGGTACALATVASGVYVGAISAALRTGGTIPLCAGSGPGLFVVCGTTTPFRARRLAAR
jgi:hypothetical protein